VSSRRYWGSGSTSVLPVATILALVACGVEAPTLQTQGVPARSRGVLVVNTDYRSTSVSALDLEAQVLSEHLITSASAAPGLSVALGGDVMLPTMQAEDHATVLIDRTPAAVLTWLDLRTAQVTKQLSVATGFASNPHDYISIAERKAYVPRFGVNLDPGGEQFDGGHDVLIVDPSVPEITGRIDLTPAVEGERGGLYARGDRAVVIAGLLRVLVVVFDAAFQEPADSRLVSIDPETDEIVGAHRFTGLTSCSNFALSPSAGEMAVACNGYFNQTVDAGFVDSAIVRLSLAGSQVTEIARYPAADLGGHQVSAVSYTGPSGIAFTTYGRFKPDLSVAAHDTLRWLDLTTGQPSPPILQTVRVPFSLGDVLCRPSNRVCFVADAETLGGMVHRFEIAESGALGDDALIEVDRTTGLPPRYLGAF